MPKKKNAKEAEKKEEEPVKEPKSGSGYFVFKDESTYKGEWKDSGDGMKKKHGKGILKTAKGTIYDGEWEADCKHGQGACTFPSGDKYIGGFSQGLFNGKGTYTWRTGAFYTGEWKNGTMYGLGELIDKDGNRFQGQYKNNQFLNEISYFVSPKDDGIDKFVPEEFVPRHIGNITYKVNAFWFGPENKDIDLKGLYTGKPREKTLSRLKSLFAVALSMPEEVWEICEKDEANGILAFIVLFGPIYRLIKNTAFETKQGLRLTQNAVKAIMPKAGEFKGAKSVFLNAAMSVVEEKETSESALKALDEISASEETPDILKSVVSYLKEQNKEKTDLIAQFGRDPRLNDLLGRENSEEETVWLKEKGFIKADTAKQEEEKEAE